MMRARVAVPFCLLLAVGCTFGPAILPGTHLGYNESIRMAVTEELLLNIVRLRYIDIPYFLSIDAISAQMGFEIGVDGEFGEVEGDPSAAIRPGVRYSDRPTISFTPQNDGEFLRNLAAPIGVDTVAYLGAQGVGIDRILNILVLNMNGLRNDEAGRDPQFGRAIELMAQLVRQRALKVGYVDHVEERSAPVRVGTIAAHDLVEAAESGFRFEAVPRRPGMLRLTETRAVPVLWIDRDERSEEATELLELLRLSPEQSVFRIEAAGRAESRGRFEGLAIRTRTTIGILKFLAQGVVVPKEHVELGIVDPVPTGADHAVFRVGVSRRRPKGASLRVKYRGHWFFVSDADRSSKSTFFVLATVLMRQSSSDTAARAPVLTLPVGQ